MSAYIIRRILFMIPTIFGIMLVSFVALGRAAAAVRTGATAWWAIAGGAAALAAWTKNEGVAFFTIFAVAAVMTAVQTPGPDA